MGMCVSHDKRRPDSRRPRPPRNIETRMSLRVLDEFLIALQKGLEKLDYGVVGDVALCKYGKNDLTPWHVDVIVPWTILHMVTAQLVSKRLGFVVVEVPGFQAGFIASNKLCYGLKIHGDRLLNVSFPPKDHTRQLAGSSARFMDLPFLLNLKAHQHTGRARPSTREDEPRAMVSKDNAEIAFMLACMKNQGIQVTSEQCPRVVCNEFWERFTRNCPGQEVNLRAIGLRPVAHDADSRSMSTAVNEGPSSGVSSNRATPRSGSASQSSGDDSQTSTPRASLRGPGNVGTPTSHTKLLRTAEGRS